MISDYQTISGSCSGRRGATVVEAAIILPLLLTFLFGIIQYGLILSAEIVLQGASAVAAREYALLNRSAGDVRTAAEGALLPVLDPVNLTQIDLTTPQLAGQPAKKVALTYELDLLVPFLVPGATNGILELTASTTMR